MPFALRTSYGPWSSGTRVELHDPNDRLSKDAWIPVIFPDKKMIAVDPKDIVILRRRMSIPESW